ncbi:alpha-hydroxy-acid oxidizing protein, partial [Blastococcus atacamensis]|uniref:alpha-hydroxy-acid oxidizing protein n=1 Tax=Blastococcus atacamensis TaxID=2070508 RepID=UPI0018E4035B
MSEAGAGRRRQNEVYRAGVFGHSPTVPVGIRRLQQKAKRVLDARAYAYVAGGAGDEVTQRANRAAFDKWAVVPRVLRDASARDTSVEIFGRRLPAPVLLGPVGALELVHPEADLAVARAAAATGVPMVFSNQGSRSMEECAAAMGDSPRWFQMYWSTSDELVESLVGRAEAAGCEALVVTLDTTMLGWRPRDLDLGHLPFALGKGIAQYTSDPVFRRLVEERAAATTSPPTPASPQPRPTPAAVKALVTMARAWP